MIKNLALIALVVILLIASFFLGQRHAVSGSITRLKAASPEGTGGEGFSLSEEQLSKLLPVARNGDVYAMRKIYFHYELSEADHAESEKWQRAMADAGDTLSQQALIKSYLIADDPAIRKKGARLCSEWLAKPKAEQVQ